MHYQTNYHDPAKNNKTVSSVSFESYSIESLVEYLRRMLFVEQDVPWDDNTYKHFTEKVYSHSRQRGSYMTTI